MMPGPTRVLECPDCSALYKQITWASVNTIGALFWTDGYLGGPMWRESTPIMVCDGCGAIRWISDVKELGAFAGHRVWDSPDQETPGEWYDAPEVRAPGVAECLGAITAGMARNEDDRRDLCIMGWQKCNHATRKIFRGMGMDDIAAIHENRIKRWRLDHSSITNSQDCMKLLEFLNPLLKQSKPQDRIFLAEIARETERYTDAIDLLKEPLPEELISWANRIRSLAKIQRHHVQPL